MSRRSSKTSPVLLAQFLQQYTVPMLKKLAALVESYLPTRKVDVIAVIQEYLENPEKLRELWDTLDSVQQAAVAEVVHALTEAFDAVAFRAKYGQDPNWGELSRWGGLEKPSLLCLFIYQGGEMPRDLKARLKAFVLPPRAVEIQTVDDPPLILTQSRYKYDHAVRRSKRQPVEIPIIHYETERMAQQDLQAVLRLIDLGKVRASEKTKRVGAAGAKSILAVLEGGDFYPPEEPLDAYQTVSGPIKAFAWPLIVQSAGLANLSGTKLQLTPAGKKALTTPPHRIISKAWSRWLKTKLLDEFNRVHTIKGQTGKGKRHMTAVAKRRATIVDALNNLPAHKWIAFDEFSRFMQAAGRTFAVSRDLWSLYIGHREYGSLGYQGFGEWHIVQGRYILAFLFEYAATMGLIDIAYIPPVAARLDYSDLWGVDDLDCLSRYDGLLYFRLNGLGAWCLGLAEKYIPAEPKVEQLLKILPNLDVVATAPLPPGDVLMLEQFAEKTSDVVWKINALKILKVLEDGGSVPEMMTFLKAKGGDNLPENVSIFFQEIIDRASHLVDRGQVRLIEAQDAALAQLIVNDRRLKSGCMLADERYIVVPADLEKIFRHVLRELGYGLPMA